MRKLTMVVILSCVSVPLAAQDLSGVWSMEISWPSIGAVNKTACTFEQEGDELTGSCWWGGRSFPLTGEVRDNEVGWVLNIDEKEVVVFDGTLNEDNMTLRGSVVTSRLGGFIAERRL